MADIFDLVSGADRAALMAAIEAEPSLLKARNGAGASVVAYAAYMGQAALARELAARAGTADPYDAIIIGNMPDLEAALAGGWDGNRLSPDGFTPLGLACFFSNEAAFDRLLPLTRDVNERAKNAQGVAAIHAAVAHGSDRMVETLLRAGGDANLKQADGFRPLHGAAQNGNAVQVGLLLLAGAQPRSATDDGKTAADYAREAGHDWLAGRLQRLI